MNVTSISSLLADYSAGDGANDAAFMDALAALTWQQMQSAHKQTVATTSARSLQIVGLQTASARVSALPITSGPRVLLGDDLQSGKDFQAMLAATGHPIATDETYTYTGVYKNAEGEEVETGKGVLSPADRALLEKGTLVGTATPEGVETRTLTDANGVRKYLLYTKDRRLTASPEDAKAIVAGLDAQVASVQKLLDADILRVQALTAKAEGVSKELSDPTRKRDQKVVENKQTQRDDNFTAAAELRRKRDADLIQQARNTKP